MPRIEYIVVLVVLLFSVQQIESLKTFNKSHYIINTRNSTIDFRAKDGRIVYGLCDVHEDGMNERKCRIVAEKTANKNDSYSCDLTLKSNGTIGEKFIVGELGRSKVLLVWEEQTTEKYLRSSIVRMKSCKVSGNKIAFDSDRSFSDNVVLLYDNSYDVFFRNAKHCRDRLCLVTINANNQVVKKPEGIIENANRWHTLKGVKPEKKKKLPVGVDNDDDDDDGDDDQTTLKTNEEVREERNVLEEAAKIEVKRSNGTAKLREDPKSWHSLRRIHADDFNKGYLYVKRDANDTSVYINHIDRSVKLLRTVPKKSKVITSTASNLIGICYNQRNEREKISCAQYGQNGNLSFETSTLMKSSDDNRLLNIHNIPLGGMILMLRQCDEKNCRKNAYRHVVLTKFDVKGKKVGSRIVEDPRGGWMAFYMNEKGNYCLFKARGQINTPVAVGKHRLRVSYKCFDDDDFVL